MKIHNTLQPPKRQLYKGFHPCLAPDHVFLLKYSPKYCKKMTIPFKNCNFGLISSKVKKIKKLEELYCLNYPGPKKEVILNLLKDKRRHIKFLLPRATPFLRYFPNIANFRLDIYSKKRLRDFVVSKGVKRLTLEQGKNLGNKNCPWRFWDHFKRLKLLESLSILWSKTFDKPSWEFLKKLNTYVHILFRLKYFQLNVGFSKWPVDNQKTWDFPNLFENVTDLRVDNDIHYFQILFLPTVKQFTNIISLNLELIDQKRPYIEFANLKVIESIQSLQFIELAVSLYSRSYLKSFLKNIGFPPFLKSIHLELSDIDWNPLVRNTQNQNFYEENPFEKDQTCNTFYQKWSHLKSLETLHIELGLQDQGSISSGLFVIPILKNLTTLSKLYYFNTYSNNEAIKRTLVFSKFLEAIIHLTPTLRTLDIADSLISLKDLNFHDLPPLSLNILNIRGYIIGGSTIDMFAKFFPKISKKSDTEDQNELGLGKVMIQNDESFVPFLKSLNKFAKRDMEVQICIDVRNLSMDFLNTSLLEFIREGNRISNLLIKIVWASRTSINRNELDILLYKYHTFKSLELETMLHKIFFHFVSDKDERFCYINQGKLNQPILNDDGLDGDEEANAEEEDEDEDEDEDEENSIQSLSDELSDDDDDDDYIDEESVYCDVEYTDEEGIEYWSDS